MEDKSFSIKFSFRILFVCLIAIVIMASSGCMNKPRNFDHIIIQPANGQNLNLNNNPSIALLVKSASIVSGIADQDFTYESRNIKKGDPCLLMIVQVENDYHSDTNVLLTATGFDYKGNQISSAMDQSHLFGYAETMVPADAIGDVVLHLTDPNKIVRIVLEGITYNVPNP